MMTGGRSRSTGRYCSSISVTVAAVLVPQAVDFADVAGGDERLDVVFAKPFHKVGELVLGEKALDFFVDFTAEAALDLVD